MKYYSAAGWIVATLTVLIPFAVSNEIFYADTTTKFFLIVFVADLLLIWCGYLLYRRRVNIIWKRQWLLLTGVGVLAAYYISSFLGVFPEKSLWSDIIRSTGVLYLTHIGIFAVVISALFKEADWSLVRRAIFLSSGLFGLLTIIGSSGAGILATVLWFDFSEEALTMGNSTFAGVYMLLAFIIGAIEVIRLRENKKWFRVGIVALLAIALSPIMFNIGIFFGKTSITEVLGNPVEILGSARASSATMLLLLGLLLGRFIIRRFAPSGSKKILQVAWVSIVLAVVIGATSLLFASGSFVQKAYIDSSTAARIIVWESSFKAVAEKPIFGWGPENFSNAFEKYFDNRLFLKENIGEIWFDRAHNIFVDSLVTIGVAGLLAMTIFAIVFLWVVYRAYKKVLIGDNEAFLLMAIVSAHILQLQTGFDTVASYVLLGVIVGYVLWLERSILDDENNMRVPGNWIIHKIAAGALIVAALISLKFVFADELRRQQALTGIFVAETKDRQQELIHTALSRISNWEGLRLSSASFIKGSLVTLASAEKSSQSMQNILKTASFFTEKYQLYISVHPDDYRARMNYAYLMLIQTVLGNDRLEEAERVINDSYDLSPLNPLTYALHATAFLYGKNFDAAQERVEAMIELNPDIEFSQEMKKYIDTQINNFPRIEVLKLENL